MAASDWMEIYRSYSGTELDEEIAKLKKDLDGGYVSQSSGSTSGTRSVGELRDRLKAAVRVKNERSGGSLADKRHGQVDFSSSSVDQF